MFKEFAENIHYKFMDKNKSPMLVVGANVFIRENVKPQIFQAYDLHLFFYPNSENVWVFSILGISRMKYYKPLWSFNSGQEVKSTIIDALKITIPDEQEEYNKKMLAWLTYWIYRCPKISLKGVLKLEPYSGTVSIPTIDVVKNLSPIRLVQGGK